jgi:hypothetical protein
VRGREALDPVTGGVESLRQCLPGGWCSSNLHLSPHAAAFDLWGFSEDDVWAVGGHLRGAALHWEGARWRQVPVPTEEPLRAVWGIASDDVWAVGPKGVALRWDGSAWRSVALPTSEWLSGVSGTSSRDVWLVGPNVALHWDGSRFTEAPGWTPARSLTPFEGEWGLAHVWAISRTDVVAAGAFSCQRWDGRRWSVTACGVKEASDIWASGPDDIWVVGNHLSSSGFNSITHRAHWDGQKWTSETFWDYQPGYTEPFESVFGFAKDDVWMNGTWHYDGHTWSRVCRGTSQRRLWGLDAQRLFGSAAGELARFDGTGWTALAQTWKSPALFGPSLSGGAWAVLQDGVVLERDAERWKGQRPGADSARYARSFRTAFGSGPEDVWATNGAGLFHWDGAVWTHMPVSRYPGAGWSISPTDAFLAGADGGMREDLGKLWRWDGRTWNPVAIDLRGAELRSFWGSGPQDVWAVGTRLVGHSGYEGVAWHWDGTTWTEVHSQPGQQLQRVFGTGRGDVWAIDFRYGPTTAAYVLRWNGHTFERVAEFHGTYYETHLAGTGPDDLWLTTGMTDDFRTRLHHFDGRTWTEREPLPGRIHRLWATPGGSTFAAEESGVIYERRRQ